MLHKIRREWISFFKLVWCPQNMRQDLMQSKEKTWLQVGVFTVDAEPSCSGSTSRPHRVISYENINQDIKLSTSLVLDVLPTNPIWWSAHFMTRSLAETDRREANTINEWWSASWLTNLPLNNVFLTGPLGPRLMDGLTEAGSISQAGFPSMSAADSTGELPPLSRGLAVINHQREAFSPHTAARTNSQYVRLAQITSQLL